MKRVSENEVIVQSWMDIVEIFAEDASENALGRHRSEQVYRGMYSDQWPILTSLQRVNKEYWTVEKHLLRNFIKYAPQNSVVFNNFWNWLTLAQHHGLPTRLIDWTYSPMIALHFALENYEEFDDSGNAAVLSVNLDKAKQLLPPEARKVIEEEGAFAFSIESLTQIWPSLEKLSSQTKNDFLIFFEPPSFNDRIINQFALLSATRNPRTIVSDWLAQHPHLYRKTIIPKKLKWEFRDRLDQMNITERMIFPGLDGLCLWLKRWYCSK